MLNSENMIEDIPCYALTATEKNREDKRFCKICTSCELYVTVLLCIR